MNKLKQAARQALEALEAEFYDDVKQSKLSKAITALRDALTEPVSQEPVAYLCPSFVDNYATGRYETCERTDYGAFPTYAAPVRTKDLTDDEIADIRMSIVAYEPVEWGRVFARAVIAAYKEKNK